MGDKIRLNGPNSEPVEMGKLVDFSVDPKQVISIEHKQNVGDYDKATEKIYLTERVEVYLKDKRVIISPYSFEETMNLFGQNLPKKSSPQK